MRPIELNYHQPQRSSAARSQGGFNKTLVSYSSAARAQALLLSTSNLQVAAWPAILATTLLVCMISIVQVVATLATNRFFIGDFTVFWTAARTEPTDIYDALALTKAQAELVGGHPGLRPFVNPPTALPWLVPFGNFSFLPALYTWTLLGLGAYFLAARQYLRGPALLILSMCPLVWISAATGQLSLFLGAALMSAVALLPKRPVIAGILFGLAATVKPHVVLLAPLALLAAREWRAFAAALLSGALAGLACLTFQGAQLWLDWIEAARGFSAIVQAEGLAGSGVTPSSIAAPTAAQPVIAVLGMAVGAATVVIAFARSDDRSVRLIALVTGCLLASPYGRKYDLVALQPAAILLLLDRNGAPRNWLFGMIGVVGATQVWSVIALSLGVLTGQLRKPAPPARVN